MGFDGGLGSIAIRIERVVCLYSSILVFTLMNTNFYMCKLW